MISLQPFQYATVYIDNHATKGPIAANNELVNFPVANLLNSQPGKVYRGDTVSEIIIDGSFSENGNAFPFIDSASIANHNLTGGQTIEFWLLNTDESANNPPTAESILYYLTEDAEQPRYAWGTGPWGDIPNVGGYGGEPWGKRDDFWLKDFNGVYASHYKIKISNLYSGMEETYFQASNLFVGKKFQPQRKNIAGDFSMDVVDPSVVSETRSQALRSTFKKPYRVVDLNWQAIAPEDAFAFRTICRDYGKRSNAIVSVAPQYEDEYFSQLTFFAKMVDWNGPIRRTDTIEELYTLTTDFREVL